MYPSDEELVKKAKEGDRDAAETLFKTHRDKIYRFLCKYMRDSHAAEDITIETFMGVYNKLALFDPEKGKFVNWLYSSAINCAKNYFAKRGRLMETSLDEEVLNGEGITPGDITADERSRPDLQAQSNETEKAIRAVIAGLNKIYKDVIMVCDVEGMSYSDAAKVLKLNQATLATRLKRAREILWAELKQKGFEL